MGHRRRILAWALILSLGPATTPASADEPSTYHAGVRTVDGETPLDLLNRCGLDTRHLRAFLLLNELPEAWRRLQPGVRYRIPVLVHDYDGSTVRTSLGLPMSDAVGIRTYNAAVTAARLKPAITDDRKVWAPYDHVLARAGSGQRVGDLLAEYSLGPAHVEAFCRLNSLDQVDGGTRLQGGHLYRLPIHIKAYGGPTVSAALGVTMSDAEAIRSFNARARARGQKPDIWDDSLIWVPYRLGDNPTYGPVYRRFEIVSDQLRECVFYLSPGHGGPDPGTMGSREGERICEDEYTLDITLRLARELERRGARVHVPIVDEGIRDEKFLRCDPDERFTGGRPIPDDQTARLGRRVADINSVHAATSDDFPHHRLLSVHIDFRSDASRRIDFDLYHHRSSPEGKRLATTLQQTLEREYGAGLRWRGYAGRVMSRPEDDDYYILRQTRMPAVLIELANINNDLDQLTFIVIESRQNIARWLCRGLLEDAVR